MRSAPNRGGWRGGTHGSEEPFRPSIGATTGHVPNPTGNEPVEDLPAKISSFPRPPSPTRISDTQARTSDAISCGPCRLRSSVSIPYPTDTPNEGELPQVRGFFRLQLDLASRTRGSNRFLSRLTERQGGPPRLYSHPVTCGQGHPMRTPALFSGSGWRGGSQ